MTGADLQAAHAARGFMPHAEGLLLHRAALAAGGGPMLEIGGYCGKSAVYLGSAARHRGGVLFSVDHHRGSEENQPGELYCDSAVVDVQTGKVDSLPHFRRTIEETGLEAWVVAVVGSSPLVASHWCTPLSLLFIDGGHTEEAAHADYAGFVPHLDGSGWLLIHDVFGDPADGGQAPFHVYCRALEEGFRDVAAEGSLRVLRR
ncbi:MAG: class I SAM-dependent methyltransferase [Candidatus Dormibacteraeota bacterium]|uniref:Class I SAM-dependent methyltransferase n=1 Tax=Candidatus Amunia macphersoniae TaxID=3127014 RepID=A0A934N8N6_9BACT|nr:class I SAM-dependent methyltransferase [Candidatus Dormibacteraeota bacterium]